MKEAHRQWKNKRVYPAFLDFLNVTLPCGDDCPVELSVPKNCRMSNDKTTLFLDFTTPVVNRSLVVLDADPFSLMARSVDNEGANLTCLISYHGPERVIYSTLERCIYSNDVPTIRKGGIVVASTLGCQPKFMKEDDNKQFSIARCSPTEVNDESHFIQVKRMKDEFHIYCPGSKIILEGVEEKCPNHVFEVPTGVSMTINGVPFESSEMRISFESGPDPMFTMAANRDMQVSLNWTDLMSFENAELKNNRQFSRAVDGGIWTWWYGLIGVIVGLIICLMAMVYFYVRSIRNVVTVQAHPLHNLIEMEDRPAIQE